MVSPSPTRVPAEMDQARTFQPVRFSGIVISAVAVPSGPASMEATHKAVSTKFLRMVGCTMSGAAGASALPGSAPALSDSRDFRSARRSETPSDAALAIMAMGAPGPPPPKPAISDLAILPLVCPLRPCKFI